MKVAELGKLMRGFGCGSVQNHNRQCEGNAQAGRFRRTDDELYVPRALTTKGEDDLLDEALSCLLLSCMIRVPFLWGRSAAPPAWGAVRQVADSPTKHRAERGSHKTAPCSCNTMSEIKRRPGEAKGALVFDRAP